MKRKISVIIMLMFLSTLCFALVDDLTGNWEGNFTLPNGMVVQDSYTFKVDGEKLTGLAHGVRGEDYPLENGVIKGSDFSFDITNQPGTIHQTGKFYGDSVTIDFNVMDHDFHEKLLRSK